MTTENESSFWSKLESYKMEILGRVHEPNLSSAVCRYCGKVESADEDPHEGYFIMGEHGISEPFHYMCARNALTEWVDLLHGEDREIRDMLGRDAKPQQWCSEPERPGYYWFKKFPTSIPEIVRVFQWVQHLGFNDWSVKVWKNQYPSSVFCAIPDEPPHENQ